MPNKNKSFIFILTYSYSFFLSEDVSCFSLFDTPIGANTLYY